MANGSSEGATLARGAFLALEIAIANPGSDPVDIGTTMQAWWTRVEVLDQRDRSVYWPFEVLSKYPPQPSLRLDPGASAQLELGLAPEEFDLEDPGQYPMSVRLPDGARSNEVVIKLLDVELTEEETYAPDHLAALAVFLTKRGRHTDARQVIDALFERGGATINGMMLLGELQESQGDNEGAIRTYEHAERLFWEHNPDSPEPPDIIATRIVRLRRQLS